ncbi:MAG: pyruvate ferredoxin oxidoreductase [Candidatus Margulisbacteria bacterium GWF2_38_17]|nr:MAG: pyruvate ferredoxin oxidoreductase [Candidatus Margulisbacteria bacterium GWD2_39_127]OGI05430.1 MAG: pyruvate ferredoxin oxidoreductase [Candidatus Margulisbacteria bacterium GWF2_38_17]OGI07832.1 MAG: pyruvate ferredoxin oxidoreductase [Candidatus Margulisbacteria bacterium GWE2_39_32]
MATLKELASKEEKLAGGHTSCAGCGYPSIIRLIMQAAKYPLVIGSATGCLEVNTTIFPYTSWKVPFIHCAFENSAATVSGVEAAYRSLVRQEKLPETNIKFIAFGGDGGTYDIGLQSLSGAMERGHDMLYVCYDNGAYMNTGIQRSGATPKYANTTTAPAGKVKQGKEQFRKDLTAILVAHGIPYIGQAIGGNWKDLTNKIEKAMEIKGPKFLNVLSTCPLGWGTNSEDTVMLTQLATETCFWPLFEVENGVYKLTYKPKTKKPIVEWLKLQTRFKHLFKPGNEALIEEVQQDVDIRWNKLLKLCGEI